jgi:hypothetical protein
MATQGGQYPEGLGSQLFYHPDDKDQKRDSHQEFPFHLTPDEMHALASRIEARLIYAFDKPAEDDMDFSIIKYVKPSVTHCAG